jgi:hypothetical protein
MLHFTLLLSQALGLPEVEDPIPDRINFGHVIGLAGAFGVLGEVIRFASPPAKREQAVRCGVLIGFSIGLAFYLLALLAQVISGI